jgi:RNA polymerase sigma-70 factor (ECF subfamily)
MMTESFVNVVARAQTGDQSALEEIVSVWRRRTLGMVTRMIGRPDDAEDVAQDVFVRLFLSLDKLREPSQFEPWMYRLIANAAIDYLRRHKRVRIRLSDLSDEQVFTIERDLSLTDARQAEQRRNLHDFAQRLLATLSPDARALLLLKEVEGLSIKELSDVFRISEDAVKVRLFRARQRLLRSLPGAKDPVSSQVSPWIAAMPTFS